MKRSLVARGTALLLLTLLVGFAASACNDSPSPLDPHGPRASSISNLWWVLMTVGTVTWIVVIFLIFLGIFHRRGRLEPDAKQAEPVGFVLVGGAVVPLVVLVGLMFFTLRTLNVVSEEPGRTDVLIEVTGHRWWWEVHYPEQDFTTANELHIPVDEPVRIALTSDDVIHSFWLPQLQGKMDLIPGKDNVLYIEADEAGVYRGECAEFCGTQHANMAFTVVAESRPDFERWLEAQQQPAPRPTDPSAVKGQQIFFGSACVYCHNVQGTTVSATIGPDLTHLMSRDRIAAGTLENTHASLGAWIINPQDAKPGNLMPPTQMDAESLQNLLDYLETLQ